MRFRLCLMQIILYQILKSVGEKQEQLFLFVWFDSTFFLHYLISYENPKIQIAWF